MELWHRSVVISPESPRQWHWHCQSDSAAVAAIHCVCAHESLWRCPTHSRIFPGTGAVHLARPGLASLREQIVLLICWDTIAGSYARSLACYSCIQMTQMYGTGARRLLFVLYVFLMPSQAIRFVATSDGSLSIPAALLLLLLLSDRVYFGAFDFTSTLMATNCRAALKCFAGIQIGVYMLYIWYI